MIHSYTLRDVVCTAAIMPVFCLFFLPPGYGFAWVTDLFRFRSRSITEQFLLSIPISLVVSAMLTNLAGRYLPGSVIMGVFLVAAAAVVVGCFLQLRGRRIAVPTRMRNTTKIGLLLAILWMLIVIASLVDLQIGHKLYVSATLYDQAVRVAFVSSAMRSGPPPVNPFSYLGSAPTARYYYYWYVLCSYPARLAHIGPRYALDASSIWAGFSLAALIPLYLKDFSGITRNLRRKSVIGFFLLAVTGLDLIPSLYLALHSKVVHADMEWWDPTQIATWPDSLLWVPHHVASVVACFIGLLALWSVQKKKDGETASFAARAVACIFAALAFAAAAGLSVYVTFTFAIFLVLWPFRFLYKKSFSDFFLYLITGILTYLLSKPYLNDLHSPGVVGAPGAVGGGFSAFGLRTLPHIFAVRGFAHSFFPALLAVLVVYLLEFGFFVIVACERFKRDIRNWSSLSEAEIACWFLALVTMTSLTFIRSTVIGNNDLAFRGAMIVQFVVLLWGTIYLDDWIFSRSKSREWRGRLLNGAVWITLVLGFCGTTYGLVMLRTYSILDDAGHIPHPAAWLPAPPNVGTYTFDIRQAYSYLDRTLPKYAIVQYNPMTDDYLPLLMYSRFQSVDAFPDCGTEFGGDVNLCAPAQTALTDLFNKAGTYDIQNVCKRLSIDVLVARETDPAWKDPTSWVWTNRPLVSNSYIRAFRCH
ncbi:MAG: hypothetical protein WBF45_02460 [Acidobacteriaceae bacterium]